MFEKLSYTISLIQQSLYFLEYVLTSSSKFSYLKETHDWIGDLAELEAQPFRESGSAPLFDDYASRDDNFLWCLRSLISFSNRLKALLLTSSSNLICPLSCTIEELTFHYCEQCQNRLAPSRNAQVRYLQIWSTILSQMQILKFLSKFRICLLNRCIELNPLLTRTSKFV